MPSLAPDQLPDFLPGPGAMLFSSFEYLLVFLPLVVIIYFWLNRHTHEQYGILWLSAASLFFYGWWSLSYLGLIVGSILFNFGMARWLGAARGARSRYWLLVLAISANIILLGYYKYADFFIGSINALDNTTIPLLHLALPLGISFFTFTQIAFLIDVYRGTASEYSLGNYCLFVTYFPHLIAGPIMHHKEMMPQFSSKAARIIDWKNVHLGLFVLAVGLFKKIVLADSLATAANEGFDNSTTLVFHQAWISSLSYTLQLYFDFSGYCDMAIGASLIINIRLPENFNSPYKARNIQDFWRRWHMTLSRWLRDYLYIPLGGNRYGILHSYAALLITFLLGGLWHGPGWTFIVWGILHGMAAALHKFWQQCHLRMPAFPGWLLTFLFVNATWVFFRADSIATAINLLKSMAGLNGFATHDELASMAEGVFDSALWNPFNETANFPARKIVFILSGMALVWLFPNTKQLCSKRAVAGHGIFSAILVGALAGFSLFCTLFLTTGTNSFIYFYF